jgi:hypothetical chaperone protein
MAQLVYGLDFGTSNSAVAVLDENGRSKVLKIGQGGSARTIRSVLFFPANQKKTVFVGDIAISEYIGSGMKGRFLQSIKSILPSESFTGTHILGFGFLGPDDLVSLIIKDLKKRADDLLGEDVKRLVLGRPARFSEDANIDSIAEQRLFIAAQKAGFEDIRFQLEPIAAALHYESSLTAEKLVLVADIGGGTSDFTIMKLSPERLVSLDRKNDILSSNGVYIGGDSFDADIMWNKLIVHFGRDSQFKSYDKMLPFPIHILSKLCKWQDIGFMKNKETRLTLQKFHHNSNDPTAIARLQALINEDLGYSLFCEIEKAKIALSDREEALIDFHQSVIDISEMINRSEFEGFIQKKLDQIGLAVDESLRLAGIGPGMIDSVFMTGGSSLIPSIRRTLSTRFGEDKIASADSFTSVVSGLALSARLFF